MIFAEQDSGRGIVIIVGSIIAMTVGTIFGKFARGDYDDY